MLYSWIQRPRQVDDVYIHFLNMYYVYTGTFGLYFCWQLVTLLSILLVRFQQKLLPRNGVVCVLVLVLSNF
jgi:hypothetical protein